MGVLTLTGLAENQAKPYLEVNIDALRSHRVQPLA
jgi:hypothetical protein